MDAAGELEFAALVEAGDAATAATPAAAAAAAIAAGDTDLGDGSLQPLRLAPCDAAPVAPVLLPAAPELRPQPARLPAHLPAGDPGTPAFLAAARLRLAAAREAAAAAAAPEMEIDPAADLLLALAADAEALPAWDGGGAAYNYEC